MVLSAMLAPVDLPEMNIRPATPADLPALRELLLHNGSADFSALTLEEIGAARTTFYVAEQGGVIMGCAALVIYNAKIGEITWLALAPMPADSEWSVAQALIHACVELARERRIYEVMLISEAEEFMNACGFQEALASRKRAYFYQAAPRQAALAFPAQVADKQPQDKL